MLLAFLLRLTGLIVFSFHPDHTHSEMLYWIRWTPFLAENPLPQFYTMGIGDYPPGYVYLLKIAGEFLQFFGLSYEGVIAALWYQMLPIIFDLLTGYVIYRCTVEGCEMAKSGMAESGMAELLGKQLAAFYWFNPAVIFLSIIYAQLDSVHTLLIALSIYFLMKRKVLWSGMMVSLALLVKLQTLFFGPIYLLGILWYVFSDKDRAKSIRKVLLAGALSVVLLGVACLPFGIENTIRQCVLTVGEDSVCALNATNLWSMLGLNFVDQQQTFCGIPYAAYGWTLMIASVLYAMFYTWRMKEKKTEYLFLGTMLIFTLSYTFSVRMHERYLFPALLMLLMAVALSRRTVYMVWYCILSMVAFADYAGSILIAPSYYAVFEKILILLSAMEVCTVVWIIYKTYKDLQEG